MLQIRKKSAKVWLHIDTYSNNFILSKFYCKTDGSNFKLVEQGGSPRKEYLYTDIEVYDDTASGTAEVFASPLELMQRLEELQYVGFTNDGEVVIANLISTDASNTIVLGPDGKLYVANLNAVSLGNVINNELSIKMTPSSDDEIVMLDSLTGEAVTAKFSAFSSGGTTKRSYFAEFKINQSFSASTSWYQQPAQVGLRGNFSTNASLTPSNNFSNCSVLTPFYVLPFNCKIKSISITGWTNSGNTSVRFCIVNSSLSSTDGVTAIQSPLIIADNTFTLQNIQINGFRFNSVSSGLNTATLTKGTEIRPFIFNNNVASNLYDTIISIEFEEVV